MGACAAGAAQSGSRARVRLPFHLCRPEAEPFEDTGGRRRTALGHRKRFPDGQAGAPTDGSLSVGWKGECELDHFEVRHWQGWYRHITLHPSDEDLSPGTPVSPCWLWPFWRCCAPGRKKPSAKKVPLSVPEIRHLLASVLRSGWHGLEHLLHRSDWRRYHPFLARIFHFRKQQLLLFAISYNCRTNAMNWILSVYEPAREYSANPRDITKEHLVSLAETVWTDGRLRVRVEPEAFAGIDTEVEQGFWSIAIVGAETMGTTGGFPDGFHRQRPLPPVQIRAS